LAAVLGDEFEQRDTPRAATGSDVAGRRLDLLDVDVGIERERDRSLAESPVLNPR
jgi:hypothetical protein